MNKEKYLKYKKKYLQLKNDIAGGQHIKISFDDISGFVKDKDGFISGNLKGPKINEIRYKDINGRWIGYYKDFSNYEGLFISDENENKTVNKYGFWDGNDYYGILDDENVSQRAFLLYTKDTNQEYGDRFKWFDADSYILYKFNNNEVIKKVFNSYNNWVFSNGYGDGFCSLYAFFLLYNKISNNSIYLPMIEEKEVTIVSTCNLLKTKKIKFFVVEYLIPLFKIIYKLKDDIKKNIELTTRNNESYNLLQNDLENLLNNFRSLNIQYISDEIFLYLSIIYNVNIIFIPFVKETNNFNPPTLYSQGKLIMGSGNLNTVKKQLLKFNNYVILLYDKHYYSIDNPSDIIKYETILKLFIDIDIDIGIDI